jgi:hypothetical protein
MGDPESLASMPTDPGSTQRVRTVGRCVLAGAICLLAVVLFLVGSWGVRQFDEVAERRQVANNLRQIVLGLYGYADENEGYFPSPTHNDPTKRDFGWRVAIMPYAESEPIYARIRDGEFSVGNDPRAFWKHPDLQKARPAYHRTGSHIVDPRMTSWRVFVGNGAAFEKGKRLRPSGDFPDGLSQTILVVEATEGVIWCSDEDFAYDPAKPLPPLGHPSRDGFLAAFGDGSVHYIPKNTDEKLIRAMITRNGGEDMRSLPGKPVP